MFCDRCGRLLNRATGKCVCADDPALAAPVDPAAASSTTADVGAVRSQAVAPSAHVPVSERELAERAVAARQVTSLNGRAPKQAAASAAATAAPEEDPYVPSGRVRSALCGLREGRRRVDLRIHDDALVVASGAEDAGHAIPLDQVVAITVQRQPWGGSIHIGAGRNGSRTLRFSKRKHSCNDVAGHLQAVDPRRFVLVPVAGGVQLAYRMGKIVAAAVVLAAVAIPVKLAFFPAEKQGDDLPGAARAAMRDACPTWRGAPLSGDALASTAEQIRPLFEQAAAAFEEFASLPADVATVQGFAPKAGRPDAPLVEAAAFSAAVDRIDSACARAGA